MPYPDLAGPSRFDPPTKTRHTRPQPTVPPATAAAWATFNEYAGQFLALNDSDNRPLALDLYRRVLAAEIDARQPLAPVVQLTLPDMTANPAPTYRKAAS